MLCNIYILWKNSMLGKSVRKQTKEMRNNIGISIFISDKNNYVSIMYYQQY